MDVLLNRIMCDAEPSHMSAQAFSVPLCLRGKNVSCQPPHNLFKHVPALLIILKLVEARASRRQQHDIARLGHSIRLAQRIL